MGITETWLSDKVFDAEVMHYVLGFNLFHCDRSGGRQGGGVALYLSEELSGDILASYDNSVCGFLVVKIHDLDTIVCVCYRHPDTTLTECDGMMNALDESLSSLSSPTPNIILMGDFNFSRNIMTWERSQEGILYRMLPTIELMVPLEGRETGYKPRG